MKEVAASKVRDPDGQFAPEQDLPSSGEEEENPSDDNISTRKEYGTSAEYLIARVKRDAANPEAPNHARAVEAVEGIRAGTIKSARQAAIHAGIVRVPSLYEQAQRVVLKMAREDQEQLADWIRAGSLHWQILPVVGVVESTVSPAVLVGHPAGIPYGMNQEFSSRPAGRGGLAKLTPSSLSWCGRLELQVNPARCRVDAEAGTGRTSTRISIRWSEADWLTPGVSLFSFLGVVLSSRIGASAEPCGPKWQGPGLMPGAFALSVERQSSPASQRASAGLSSAQRSRVVLTRSGSFGGSWCNAGVSSAVAPRINPR